MVKEMQRKNLSIREISEKHNMNYSTFYSRLKEYLKLIPISDREKINAFLKENKDNSSSKGGKAKKVKNTLDKKEEKR